MSSRTSGLLPNGLAKKAAPAAIRATRPHAATGQRRLLGRTDDGSGAAATGSPVRAAWISSDQETALMPDGFARGVPLGNARLSRNDLQASALAEGDVLPDTALAA